MSQADLHTWTLDPKEAAQLQDELRERLVLEWDGRPVATVGGVDMSVREDTARAAVVVLRYPDLAPLEAATAEVPLDFPYIPGLLAFREGPAVLAAWNQLQHKPDLVLFDGQGIAHPRGMGIAAHMGLWLERPTIGVAKSRLYGRYTEPGPNKGDRTDLVDPRNPGRVVGVALRTRPRTNPLFISPGHMIDLAHCVEFVLNCCTRYRLPEPTRWAHRVAGGEVLPTAPNQQNHLL